VHLALLIKVDFAAPSHLAVRSIAIETTAMTTLKEVPEPESLALMARAGAVVQLDWPARERLAVVSPPPARKESALFMSESVEGLNIGAHFLDRLSPEQMVQVQAAGRSIAVRQGEMVFNQGEHHDGIFIIRRGQVRVYYTAPSAREITLAYWTPGHFIGGPDIYGGGMHMWSGVAVEDCEITALSGASLQKLLIQMPAFALALIDGLIAKGKCYSSMAQILGTRSVIERLAQYLLNLSELYGVSEGDTIVINRKVTHDQIAAMVGSTRQWVTMMLKRFQTKRIIAIEDSIIRIKRIDSLEMILFKD
jgi:CRP/FNR family transcriptional regulator, cyclic AMP receptor protein